MKEYPLLVEVRRGSTHDGPGIRSVVFFKGCPLRCSFCHNPEAQDLRTEIGFYPHNCVGCGACLEACPRGAVDLQFPGRILRDLCDRCAKCVDACPGNGLMLIGKYFPVEALTGQLMSDLPFYRHSGGGVTLSGGECTLFPYYVERLLKALKERHVHVVVETCGYFNYRSFRTRILPYVDLIYYDIKLADPGAHKQQLGRPNGRILENFRRLARESTVELHPRIPLVPGLTATEENISSIVRLLRDAGARQVSLLPYNPMGLHKHRTLGRPVPDLPEQFMDPQEEKEAYEILAKCAGTR